MIRPQKRTIQFLNNVNTPNVKVPKIPRISAPIINNNKILLENTGENYLSGTIHDNVQGNVNGPIDNNQRRHGQLNGTNAAVYNDTKPIAGTIVTDDEEKALQGTLPDTLSSDFATSLAGTLPSEIANNIRGPLPEDYQVIVISPRARLYDILKKDLPFFFEWVNTVQTTFGHLRHIIVYMQQFYRDLIKINFNISDYPTRSNISPFWQHLYWRVLHVTSFLVVGNPKLTGEFSEIMRYFHLVLPCVICRIEYEPLADVVSYEILANVDAAYVIWKLHDTVSARLKKANRISFPEACALYSQSADNRRLTPQFSYSAYLKELS